jgi:hypothetical protein
MGKCCMPAGAAAERGFCWRASLAAAGCLLLALCSGCGGDYSQKVDNWSGNKFAGAGASADLYDARELKGTNPTLMFAWPQIFKDGPMENGQGDSRKAKPPMVDIPGLKLTCEAFAPLPDNPGNQGSFYFYIGTTTAAAGAKDAVLNGFKSKLGGIAEKTSIDDWIDFPVEAAGGNKVWRKLRYTGSQDFCVKDKDGKETYPKLPGVFEVYVIEESGSVVIFAFRAPLSLEQPIAMDKLGQAVAGSLAKK